MDVKGRATEIGRSDFFWLAWVPPSMSMIYQCLVFVLLLGLGQTVVVSIFPIMNDVVCLSLSSDYIHINQWEDYSILIHN